MQLKQILPGIAGIALVAACASDPVLKPPASAAAAITQAEAALKAGQTDKAVGILNSATTTYPADKQAWLMLAQHSFDTQKYGEAITRASQVINLDQDDMQAHSILAVSGLRVSVKALTDLAQKNNLNGNVKNEATELAKLLRSRLGDELVVKKPKEPGKVLTGEKKVAVDKVPGKPGAKAAETAANPANPF